MLKIYDGRPDESKEGFLKLENGTGGVPQLLLVNKNGKRMQILMKFTHGGFTPVLLGKIVATENGVNVDNDGYIKRIK